MRSVRNDTYDDGHIDKHGQPYRQISLEQRNRLRKDYMAHVPRWRYPLIGYLVTIPVIAVVIICELYIAKLFGEFLFSSTFSVLSILFVALFWGVGPAVFAIALNFATLYYYFVLPKTSSDFGDWRGFLQLLPFVISGLVIAIITAQRERARLQAMASEDDLQHYAQELEEINRQLEDANQMKDRFLSIASHELKTPITTIRGQAQLMLRRLAKQKQSLGDSDGMAAALERINDQTGRLTMLIDDLLDVSSMRTGKVALNKRLCDIGMLCREVLEDQRLLTEREIVLHTPEIPICIQVDPDRITQVITNLVSNALKYSPAKSKVEVYLKLEDAWVLLEVKDYGKGIKKELQEQIFETFYRTPDAQSSSKRGLGLGLAITKDIVERHEGRIWCESQPGHGSSFFIKLPANMSSI
jgi:signal transduction histidine kinase